MAVFCSSLGLCVSSCPNCTTLVVGVDGQTHDRVILLIHGPPVDMRHYWISLVCRVLQTLGKALKTPSKGFAECSTQQTTLGYCLLDNGVFAECADNPRHKKVDAMEG